MSLKADYVCKRRNKSLWLRTFAIEKKLGIRLAVVLHKLTKTLGK
jgi:hypothetical protein